MGLIEENSASWSTCKRVVWIRPGALGDLLVGLASLVETAALFPAARVTVVGPAIWTQVLSPLKYPFIERIAAVERKGFAARIFEPHGADWIEVGAAALIDVLRECDAAVNTNIDSARYGFTCFRAGVRVRVGSAPASLAWLYTHCSPYFGKDPLIHERDVPLLLLEYATPGLQKFMRSTAANRRVLEDWVARSRLVAKWRELGLPPARELDRGRAVGGFPAGQFVLVNPTASRREKTWPVDLMRSCLLRLRARGLSLVVIGAPSESEWLAEVAGAEFPVVQPSSLVELQNIVASARALLTNGSSMQFIAGTTQTPVLTIFGRGQPLIWGPIGRFARVVRARFAESDAGSTFAGFETEVSTYRTITVEEVETAFVALLSESSSESLFGG